MSRRALERSARAVFVAEDVADFSVLMDAITTATILCREPDEDSGARDFVVCPTLRGSFLYCREEGERRIRKEFPELPDEAVRRALNHLNSRVRMQSIPPPRERTNWVNSWRN